jgi:hypothetical protein
LSVAFPETVITPAKVAPLAGAEMETVGGEQSCCRAQCTFADSSVSRDDSFGGELHAMGRSASPKRATHATQ